MQGLDLIIKKHISNKNKMLNTFQSMQYLFAHTFLFLWQEACSLLTVSGLNSLVGTIQDFGCGEEKTLSSPSKFGCAEDGQSGCPAQGMIYKLNLSLICNWMC